MSKFPDAFGNSYRNITTQTTTVVKAGPGIFDSIVFNAFAANGVVTIYDGVDTNGTVIATITSPATLLDQGPSAAQYNVAFQVGLTIVTATANQNITVSFR